MALMRNKRTGEIFECNEDYKKYLLNPKAYSKHFSGAGISFSVRNSMFDYVTSHVPLEEPSKPVFEAVFVSHQDIFGNNIEELPDTEASRILYGK